MRLKCWSCSPMSRPASRNYVDPNEKPITYTSTFDKTLCHRQPLSEIDVLIIASMIKKVVYIFKYYTSYDPMFTMIKFDHEISRKTIILKSHICQKIYYLSKMRSNKFQKK